MYFFFQGGGEYNWLEKKKPKEVDVGVGRKNPKNIIRC